MAAATLRYRAIPDETLDESLWRTLRYFSVYRLVVALMFIAMDVWLSDQLSLGAQLPRWFNWSIGIYLAGALLALGSVWRWRCRFNMQLSLQVLFDIALLTLMMYASGGAKSGLATMILVVLVGAGLVGQGRLVLFYAAMATLALLFEQSYRILTHQNDVAELFRTGITSIAFFGSAIAARYLARRVVANEELARRRGIELADQLRINERVIRDMQDGVLVIDAASRVRQANQRALALLGLPPPNEAPAAHEPRETPLLASLCPSLASEFLVRRTLGVESTLSLRAPASGKALHVRFLPPGEGALALIFLEDLARLQQEAQQLKLAALGRLTANLAHEIRNPLASISHAAELLAELLADAHDSAGVPRLTAMIGDNVQRLNRLVSEVTELGRRDRAQPERIEIAPFLGLLVDELAMRQPDCATRVAIDVPAGMSICFDRGHLHRVFANLLGNALTYASPAPGAIRIEARCAESEAARVNFHLIDDGPGIDNEVRQKLFEPFFTTRAASIHCSSNSGSGGSGSSGSSGTGLGLYIARELCDANGARLTVGENAPGGHFCLSCAIHCHPPAVPS